MKFNGSLADMPDFGHLCVCCNAPETQLEYKSLDSPPTDLRTEPIMVPVCAACRAHVHWRRPWLTRMAAGVGLVGMALAVLAAVLPNQPFLWLGAPLALALLLPLGYNRWFSRNLGGAGHHSGMRCTISHFDLHIDTSNKALVDRLAAGSAGEAVVVEG